MRKIVLMVWATVLMAGCKNTEEVKVDQTAVESPDEKVSVEVDTTAQIQVEPQKVTAVSTPGTTTEVSPQKADPVENYTAFGEKFAPKNVLAPADMIKKYKSLKTGDTLVVQFKSKVNEVCKKKGCWMSMALPGEKESFVRFKDYGFFVPKNADGSEAIVRGKAYLDVVSVAQLQHYAKDGGKSQEEIDKITEPKITYAFQADGVLMK